MTRGSLNRRVGGEVEGAEREGGHVRLLVPVEVEHLGALLELVPEPAARGDADDGVGTTPTDACHDLGVHVFAPGWPPLLVPCVDVHDRRAGRDAPRGVVDDLLRGHGDGRVVVLRGNHAREGCIDDQRIQGGFTSARSPP
jgi:hypothetical protein